MAKYSDDGVLPVSRDKLWVFLNLHAKDEVIPLIHPDVVKQTVVRQSGGEVVLDRGINFRGKIRPNTWKITSNPPDLLRWEVVAAPEGPMGAGTWVESRYSEVPGGTRIVSQGEVTVVGLPRLFQRRAARVALGRIDAQDLAYLRDHA